MDCKTCSICGESKAVTEYYVDSRHADGLYDRCKRCHNALSKKSALKRQAKARETRERRLAEYLAGGVKECKSCHEAKSFDDFYVMKSARDGRRGICKACWIEQDHLRNPLQHKKSPGERFEERVSRPGDTTCWVWTGASSRGFWFDGDTIDARRYVLLSRGVELPGDRRVVDTCGNERCVNPQHLTLKPKGNRMHGQFKRCSKCQKVKPLDQFCKSGTENRYNYCRPCAAEDRREYRTKNPRAVRNAVLSKYGLTLESHAAMLEAQGGVCAICGGEGGAHGLCIDHDHDTGIVRALLCSSCNAGIAMLKHDAERIGKAADYVRKWGAIIASSRVPAISSPIEDDQATKNLAPPAIALS